MRKIVLCIAVAGTVISASADWRSLRERREGWTRIPLNASVAVSPTPDGRFALTFKRGF